MKKHPSAVLFFLGAFLLSSWAYAISRDQIMEMAASYAEHVWTATTSNMTASCSAGYQSDYSPGSYTGVAYDWGGFDTLEGYDNKLSEAYGAGSHKWHGTLSCTTGVDCSGYVSRCWGVPTKKGTSTIHTVSHEISPSEILEGDAYNKAGSHMVLWVGLATDGSPIFFEASGSASKVRYNTSASWSYFSEYKSIRYDNVWDSEGDPVGTPSSPIEIASFPYYDERSTLSSGSSVYDSYGCAPTTGEAGPEVVYFFTVNQPGLFEAHLTDGPGVDIDVHLLTDLDPDACIARNHTDIAPMAIEPGTYYVIMDSWSDASGNAYPGSYTLEVDFQPTGPPVEEGDPVEEERENPDPPPPPEEDEKEPESPGSQGQEVLDDDTAGWVIEDSDSGETETQEIQWAPLPSNTLLGKQGSAGENHSPTGSDPALDEDVDSGCSSTGGFPSGNPLLAWVFCLLLSLFWKRDIRAKFSRRVR